MSLAGTGDLVIPTRSLCSQMLLPSDRYCAYSILRVQSVVVYASNTHNVTDICKGQRSVQSEDRPNKGRDCSLKMRCKCHREDK